jgi:hypothetical protein
MKARRSDQHRARNALAMLTLAALLAGLLLEAPNVIGRTKHAGLEASFLRLSAAQDGRHLPAEAANSRALAMRHRGFRAKYAPSIFGAICLTGAVATGSLALAFWVRAEARLADSWGGRITTGQMMGVVMITAFLLPGFVFVSRSDPDLRSDLAVIVSFFYIITSPALLFCTASLFWPERSAG